MNNLKETIEIAKQKLESSNMNFVTIWKTGKSYGFNFEKQKIGYSYTEYGVKRIVLDIISK